MSASTARCSAMARSSATSSARISVSRACSADFQRDQPQRVQLGGGFAFLFLQFAIALGGAGLALQMVELARQFLAHVVQPLEVLLGVPDPVFGFAAALLVLRDAGRFFEIDAQVFRLRLDELADHALLDDRVAARPETGAEEDVHDVAATALRAVQEIGRLRVARDLAPDRDLARIRRIRRRCGRRSCRTSVRCWRARSACATSSR